MRHPVKEMSSDSRHDGDTYSENGGRACDGQASTNGISINLSIQKAETLHNTQNGSKQTKCRRNFGEEWKHTTMRMKSIGRQFPSKQKVSDDDGPYSFHKYCHQKNRTDQKRPHQWTTGIKPGPKHGESPIPS